MDFIERWFNISPDGVSGTLEVLYVAAFILLIAFIIIRLRRYLISLFLLWYREQFGKHESGDR